MPTKMFVSLVRPAGDLAGVFEYDGETGYFYLYQTAAKGRKIVDSLHIVSGTTDFTEKDVSIAWDKAAQKVALFIRGAMWAVFDRASGAKLGGNYKMNTTPKIAQSVEFITLTH